MTRHEVRNAWGVQGQPIPILTGELIIGAGRSRKRMQQGELIAPPVNERRLKNELAEELLETSRFIRHGRNARSVLAVLSMLDVATVGEVAVGSRSDLRTAEERLSFLVESGVVRSESNKSGETVYSIPDAND